MCRIRYVERAAQDLWARGLISGELHPGIGEEAVAAGVVAHLREGDAVASDYRSTPPLVARGVDLGALFGELVGDPAGLCGGRAGHMHLMSEPLRVAASGIVGAPGPLACGFGLAVRREGRGGVAVAFFGDGALNQGSLMEALNLAAAWRLPVVFVCKDNRWAATTRSSRLTGGGPRRRAHGLGLPVIRVDGGDVLAVERGARRAVDRARTGGGPTFLLARCRRPEGHVAGDPVQRVTRTLHELRAQGEPLLAAALARPGAPPLRRARALAGISAGLLLAGLDARTDRSDPVARLGARLPAEVAARIDLAAREQVAAALATVPVRAPEGAS